MQLANVVDSRPNTSDHIGSNTPSEPVITLVPALMTKKPIPAFRVPEMVFCAGEPWSRCPTSTTSIKRNVGTPKKLFDSHVVIFTKISIR